IAVNNGGSPPWSVTVPDSQFVLQNITLVFSSAQSRLISLGDPTAGSNPREVTLDVTDGDLTLAGTSDLTFSDGDGTADTTMTFQGTVSDINAALNGLNFHPPSNFFGGSVLC